ncbi:hypothetical protein AAEX28_01115 [Lentisphaerota bacterium WC36G]|nr:hypothetical protein LJT99_03995 [Lentisphaerae bacterium WC36]
MVIKDIFLKHSPSQIVRRYTPETAKWLQKRDVGDFVDQAADLTRRLKPDLKDSSPKYVENSLRYTAYAIAGLSAAGGAVYGFNQGRLIVEAAHKFIFIKALSDGSVKTVVGIATSAFRSITDYSQGIKVFEKFKNIYDNIYEAIEARLSSATQRVYVVKIVAASIFCTCLSAVASVLFKNLSGLHTLISNLFAYIFPVNHGWLLAVLPAFATIVLGVPVAIIQVILFIGAIKQISSFITTVYNGDYSYTGLLKFLLSLFLTVGFNIGAFSNVFSSLSSIFSAEGACYCVTHLSDFLKTVLSIQGTHFFLTGSAVTASYLYNKIYNVAVWCNLIIKQPEYRTTCIEIGLEPVVNFAVEYRQSRDVDPDDLFAF